MTFDGYEVYTEPLFFFRTFIQLYISILLSDIFVIWFKPDSTIIKPDTIWFKPDRPAIWIKPNKKILRKKIEI